MKQLLLLVIAIIFVTPLFAQIAPERKLIDLPDPMIPGEAVKSGLGGVVSVRVSVDNAGNVIGIEDLSGPGAVCATVRRPDVLALREAAKAAALNAKFTPSDVPGYHHVQCRCCVSRTPGTSRGPKQGKAFCRCTSE